MNLLNKFTSNLAIDVGSSRTRVVKDGTVIIDEPTEILATISDVVRLENGEIRLENVEETIKPVDFEIQNFHWFQLFLKKLIKSIEPKSLFKKKHSIYLSIPLSMGDTGKRALRDAAELSGANEVYMVHSSFCSAINIGLSDSTPIALVDFGSSKLEVSIVYKKAILADNSIRLGTDRLEELITNYVKRNFKIIMTGEQIRTLLKGKGSRQEYHIIDQKHIPTEELQSLIDNYKQWIVGICHSTIEKASSQIAIGNDLYFTGGGSLYTDLCSDIASQVGKTARFSHNPCLDNVKGLWQASLIKSA